MWGPIPKVCEGSMACGLAIGCYLIKLGVNILDSFANSVNPAVKLFLSQLSCNQLGFVLFDYVWR